MRFFRVLTMLALTVSLGAGYASAAQKKISEKDLKLAYEHQQKGNAHDENGNLDEAVKEYKESLAFNPADTNTLFNLGTVYLKINKPEEAARAFEAIIKIEKKDTESYNLLGLAYRGCGRVGDAIKTWEKSLSIDPKQTLPKKLIEEAKAAK